MENIKYENIINTHLDKIDGIKDDVKNNIKTFFDKLNIREFLKTPDSTIDLLVKSIITLMIKKYSKSILKESKEYVNRVDNANEKES